MSEVWPPPWPPTWQGWKGFAQHFVIGIALTLVLRLLHTPPLAVFLAVGIAGASHELGDRDFVDAPGAPWNGIVDLLAFLPGPLVNLFVGGTW